MGTAIAAFIGIAPKGPENVPTLVSNWTQFVDKFGGLVEGAYLAYAVYGYFLNGGGNCYVVRIGTASAAGGGKGGGKREPKQLAAGPQTAQIGNYVFTAKNASRTPSRSRSRSRDPEGESPEEGTFKVAVTVEGRSPEVYDGVSAKPDSPQFIVTKLAESKLVTVEEADPASAGLKPRNGTFDLVVPEPAEQPIVLDDIGADNYVGDSADRTGFSGLEEVEEVTMVAVPDLMAAFEHGAIDLETVKAVQLAVIAHCELMGDRMAILDAPPGLSAQDIAKWRRVEAGYDSKFAALY